MHQLLEDEIIQIRGACSRLAGSLLAPGRPEPQSHEAYVIGDHGQVRDPDPDVVRLNPLSGKLPQELSLAVSVDHINLGIPGIAARVFTAAADEQVNVLMISQSSSEQSICFVVPQDASQRTLQALTRAFQYDILRHNVEHIWSQDDVAILAVVGERMRGTVGIAARLFSALAESGINILSIAQGSSEHNISLVIAAEDVDRAVRAAHATFELGRNEE